MQPMSDDLLHFVARLSRFASHVACARDDANVFWAAMFSEQVEIADRMLIVFFAVDAEERRGGLINDPLGH